ncbi:MULTISPECIES: MerR family transcriptional regulator [unclassified Micromonospora]|uniref:MerR family transcriptional regulator n=2 Tax=Micromonospora TaxID=1873 RepID=UPI001C5D34A8|nr:MerR family transcriptional regulator [Micromonospora sp. RL09-050-HVF-A]MBW4701736.1 MerR family transcriptional regulator [Micromonospora sp. RL09-050-HVF-A]
MRKGTSDMRIGEFARRCGVSARSVRYYEQQRLIAPGRAANGYREYDESAVVRVRNIHELLDSGLTIEDIRLSIDEGCLDEPLSTLPRCPDALRVATDRLGALDRRIAALQDLRGRLARQLLATRSAMACGGETVTDEWSR